MNGLRRFMTGITAGLVLSGLMGGAALPAFAAAAVYVDDTNANNGSINCPATANTEIQDGIDAAQLSGAKTVIVCEGSYTSGGHVSLFANGLTVKALGNVIVSPSGPFGGELFSASQSKNVNFQGFIIDAGSSNLQGASAFYFFDASGSVSKNTVKHWRSGTPYSPTGTNYGVYIDNETNLKVTVDRNTFADMSNYGVFVNESLGAVTISNNFIQFYTTWLGGSPNHTTYGVTGISLRRTVGAKVVNNKLTNEENLFNTAGMPGSFGIIMTDTKSSMVASNDISKFRTGLRLNSDCTPDDVGFLSNTISKNVLTDGRYGIVMGQWGSCSTANYQSNKIMSNKIFTWGTNPLYGIDATPAGGEVISGNTIKGNTIAGYGAVSIQVAVGNTGTPNTILVTPPPGN
jgi:hypothetical protein